MRWRRVARPEEVEMPLLLTILSVLALWALLIVLIAGLLLILKPLQSIRSYMEKITMGVRAIERETLPLGARSDALAASFDETGATAGNAARHLAAAGRDLEAAAPRLRSRS
jgi:uncharacterized protein YoxC